MRSIAITGATGFIGQALVRALVDRGDHVVAVTRDPAGARAKLPAGVEVIAIETLEAAGPWQAQVAACDAVINLAGQPIAGRRWDAREKQLIHDSRVEATRLLVEGIAAAAKRPRVLVNASGADYYPFAFEGGAGFDDDPVPESDPAGDGFLARVCRDWEDEAIAAEALGVRVVRMRTGVVLGPGGALARMTTPFKLFAGGRLGSGTQWFSWIHLDDAIAAYLRALDDEQVSGALNLVAPEASRAADVARAVGHALHRPSWLPVPAFAIRAAVGEVAEYLLHGRRVVPAALERLGFAFRHPQLEEAVRASLG